LLGLFLPASGSVLIDGQPIDAASTKAWRRRVGYVPQDVFLLDGSISNNIRFGRGGDGDEAQIRRALEQAQIADFIDTLPDGADTVVGERGVRLSGGQRQRLGIARALYGQPDVLILDEATSALDTATEAAVSETVSAMRSSLTMVIVAHRLSTVKDCDTLILMELGRVAGVGDFETLRRESKLFSELARLARIGAAGV